MQRLSLILNLLLLAAVIYLFVDRFSQSSPSEVPTTTAEDATSPAPLRIAYVDADSLLNNYALFKQKQEAMAAREKREDEKLRAKGRALEREIRALQEKASTGTMTPKDLASEEERLTRQQQELMADQERITRELMEESNSINETLQKDISNALRSLKADLGYDYVLSYGVGSPVLAVNDSFDVTNQVLRILNRGLK